MKNNFLFLLAAALLAACGSPDTSDLGKKRLELDSLKAAYKELGEKIKEADLWIADHDTTVKKNLPAVTTLVLEPTRFEHFVQAHGHVKADKSADLYSMGGRVRSILVKEGDRVRKGQLLVDLDNDAIEKNFGPYLPLEVVVDPRRRSEASVLLDVLALAGHRSAGGPEPLAIVRREVEPSEALAGNLAAARPPSPYAVTFPQGIVWAVIACAATFAVSLVAERTRGTLLRLLVAPLRPLEILAGKALACALAIVGMELVLVALGLAFGVVPQHFGLLALALASTAAGFVGIMMLLAALGRRTHSAAGLAWMVMMMLALLGGGMLPLFLMPAWMQTLAAASPVAWALLAIEGATWRGLGLVELALPCAGLIGLGLGSALVGARLVREP